MLHHSLAYLIHEFGHGFPLIGYIAPAYRTETIKDTIDFISFIEETKIGIDTILVSMDVSRKLNK